MKKILHLFRSEKFTGGFVQFMNSELKFEHTFWVYGEDYIQAQEETAYLKEMNVRYYPRIDIKLNKTSTEEQMKKFDLIIYHGIFDNLIIDYFFKHKILLEKLVLYFWGGDKNIESNWKSNMKRKYVIKNSTAIVTIIPQDYIDIKKRYQPRGKHFCAKYSDIKGMDILNFMEKNHSKKNINIQIGNSATDTNRHIDILNILEKYKEKNIRIYVPLSYGEKEYAKKVIEYGKNVFGEKLIPLTKFMSLEEYYLLMGKIDIAIFNMVRQQALGNIWFQMQLGKKIYLNRDGELWDYFVNDLKCDISAVDEINRSSFEQFVEFSKEKQQYNTAIINKNFSREKSIRQWEEIFNTL